MQNRLECEYLLSISDRCSSKILSDKTMNWADIVEYRTTWNNDFFVKTRPARLAAQRSIRKSIAIGMHMHLLITGSCFFPLFCFLVLFKVIRYVF
jgi:hypothetical protein